MCEILGEEKNSPSLAGQEERSASHVDRFSDPAQGHLCGDGIAGGLEGGLHHLCGKGPAGEDVAGDVAGAEVASERPRQVVQAGLAGGVGVVGDGGHADAVDAADVDDAGRVRGRRRRLQQRQAQLRQREDALQVEREHFRPGRVRVRVDVGAPGRPGVVDQHVQAGRLELREPRHERLALGQVLKVGWEGVRRAAAFIALLRRVELRRRRRARCRVSSRQVHFGAVGHEAFGNHAADAFGAWSESVSG